MIRHFSQIPLADLEMVIPDKTVFVPPMVFVQVGQAQGWESYAGEGGAVLANHWKANGMSPLSIVSLSS